mgnify:CR=1 FL=1
MTLVLALAVGLLTASGVYLLLARRMFPVILGLSLLTHAANLVMLSAGDHGSRAPIVVDGVARHQLADPVPQALVLTAIVISMAVTLYLLVIFATATRELGSDAIRPAPASDTERDEASVLLEIQGHGRRSP